MALQVSGNFETPFGTTVPTTYWRWVGLGVDVATARAVLTLQGYVDETAFATGKKAVGQKGYEVTGSDFFGIAGQIDGPNPTALSDVIYAYVKAHDPYFAGAATV